MEHKDKLDKHNIFSRISATLMMVVFGVMSYFALYTDKALNGDFVLYSFISMWVVFGGITLISNNIGKILDIIRGRNGNGSTSNY